MGEPQIRVPALLEVLNHPRHPRAAGGVVVELPYTGRERLSLTLKGLIF